MDERIITILKAIAYGETAADMYGDSYCLYCSNAEHEPTCPVSLARAALKEQGTPLLEYRIDFEQRHAFGNAWFQISASRLAFSEQEALKGFEDSPNPDDQWNMKRRNAKATPIREVL